MCFINIEKELNIKTELFFIKWITRKIQEIKHLRRNSGFKNPKLRHKNPMIFVALLHYNELNNNQTYFKPSA